MRTIFVQHGLKSIVNIKFTIKADLMKIEAKLKAFGD